MRHRLSRRLGVKITSNAFFVRATALAATEYPLTVGRLIAETPVGPGAGIVIRIAEHVNVGFAVNTARGLIVPVIQHAEKLSLAEIAEEEKRLTAGARSNTLTLDDLEGETISLSNLGAYDIDSFVGIVPPPASTILTIGKTAPAIVPGQDDHAVRKMVSLSLAADHRIMDPAYAAGFLQCVVSRLKVPESLL